MAHPVPSLLFDRSYLRHRGQRPPRRRCSAATRRRSKGSTWSSFLPGAPAGSLRRDAAGHRDAQRGGAPSRRQQFRRAPAARRRRARACDAPMLAPRSRIMTEHERGDSPRANKEFRVVHVGGRPRSARTAAHPQRIHRGARRRMRRDCSTMRARSFLKEILKAADRMEGLIDGLLALVARRPRGDGLRKSRPDHARRSSSPTTCATARLRAKSNAQVDAGITGWGDVAPHDDRRCASCSATPGNTPAARNGGAIRFHAEVARRAHLVSACRTTARASTWRTPSRLFQPFIAAASAGRISGPRHSASPRCSAS